MINTAILISIISDYTTASVLYCVKTRTFINAVAFRFRRGYLRIIRDRVTKLITLSLLLRGAVRRFEFIKCLVCFFFFFCISLHRALFLLSFVNWFDMRGSAEKVREYSGCAATSADNAFVPTGLDRSLPQQASDDRRFYSLNVNELLVYIYICFNHSSIVRDKESATTDVQIKAATVV